VPVFGTLARAATAAAVALVCAGCQPAERIGLHYLPGFVPGSENLFRPVRIAVTPVSGAAASGRIDVGAIYRDDGTLEKSLYMTDAGKVVTDALMRGLADAGLKPIALAAPPADGKPPPGTDYLISAELEELGVNKHFGPEKTVHGQYFTMKATARIKFTLASRADGATYSAQLTGREQEPPAPVGGEVFLPLETEPSESLSVAMSRAIGALMLEPQLQAHLPLRVSALPTPALSIAPTAAPSPAAPPAHH
jgi:hypothetical protein